ncbi:ATP-binding protein [Candidatus Bealeia paramacronuclearis]|uniref:ATP-binding protein n=1 Tax=Candidatus Bealeia paramacronuclearis TaxID=1921001 RepID=UPI002F2663D9
MQKALAFLQHATHFKTAHREAWGRSAFRQTLMISFGNLIFVGILGALLLAVSDWKSETLILVGTLTISTFFFIFLLLWQLKSLTQNITDHRLEQQSYLHNVMSQIFYDKHKGFVSPNLAAQKSWWWGQDLTRLKEYTWDQESKNAYDRFFTLLSEDDEAKEIIAICHGNEKEWWEMISHKLEDGFLISVENITDAHEIEKRFKKDYALYSRFFNNSGDGYFSIDEKGILHHVNKSMADWLEYRPEDLKGKSFLEILARPHRDFLRSPERLKELHGTVEFLTASQRIKGAPLSQRIVPEGKGFSTCSIVNLGRSQALQSMTDMGRVIAISPIPVAFLNDEGHIQNANTYFSDKYWEGEGSPEGSLFLDLVASQKQEEVAAILRDVADGQDLSTPLEIYFENSLGLIASVYIGKVNGDATNPGGLFLQFHDITEQKKLETQLVQSQKMQAVGQLAGGIAHDFNNLLTAMIGFCDLLLQRHTPGDQSFTDIMQIKQNANRAANLVRQLLAFSRQQTLQPKVLDITDCLTELSALLRRLIGSNIELKIKHTRDLGLVLVDQGQFEQVVINMVVNARDAMENGGDVTIKTSNLEVKKTRRQGHDEVPPGSYVLIEVIDNGIGIPHDNLDRIFDPFFSTKALGSGTGLGLSTVYGIIKQTGGFIQVDSKPEKGTKFSIFLPRYVEKEEALPLPEKKKKWVTEDLSGSSTILLVEDEDAVRLFSARALRSKGYKVIEASNGLEALEFIKKGEESLDLIITDVVMPQMDGPTLVNELSKHNKDLKVIFISGYTEDAFRNKIKDDMHIQFLGKPFSLAELASRVKEVLADEENIKLVG